jgi:hypothetical protein
MSDLGSFQITPNIDDDAGYTTWSIELVSATGNSGDQTTAIELAIRVGKSATSPA